MILITLVMTSLQAFSQENPMGSSYAFSGACSSQGSWTQSALASTQNLRKVTLQLKDDANCKALGTSVQAAIGDLESQIKTASDTPRRASRLAQIPQEIGALRDFATGSSEMRSKVLGLMMDRSMEGATLSAQVPPPSREEVTSNSMIDFGARLKRSTTVGLSMLNQVVDAIPQLDQCLTGDGQAALGSYLSMAVQVASSFASGGGDTNGSQLALTISKITNLVRERKYTKVLRKLNQQEFMSSMACLMEVTSESFCQARDGMNLFKTGMASLNLQNSKNISNQTVSEKNPFAGYYILNTHVPNITRWLQKLQIGVDPKLPTDALFQNKILDEVNDYNKGVKSLLGLYNTSLLTIKSLPTLEGKQNAVVALVNAIYDQMVNGGSNRGGDRTNFFITGKTYTKIPFLLMEIPIPDQVSGKVMPMMNYSDWLQYNMANIPALQDPETLAEKIGRNMKSIIAEANLSSIEYFNKWFIVDKMALATESMVDINYSVRDSLKAIDDYLKILQSRVVSLNGEISTIPMIVDTRVRLKKILDQYDRIQSLGREFNGKNYGRMSDEELQKIPQAYEELINTVYDQFMVMLARSGFVANRLTTFVYQDYIMLIRNKVNFTDYQRELFTALGMGALERMIQNLGGNPANVQSDLNMALRINKGNIEALEMLLKDNVIATISELKLTADGKYGNASALTRDSLNRLMKDYAHEKGRPYFDIPQTPLSLYLPIPQEFPLLMAYLFQHSDRYRFSSPHMSEIGPQTEYNDVSGVYAQLCVQSLAFFDQKPLIDLCQRAVLTSPMTNDPDYSVGYLTRLNSHMNDKDKTPQTRVSLNHSERICAFRDFNRKNMVLYMAMGKH